VNRNKSRVLVTGAGGFIGHHLVTFVKAQGHVVCGVDCKAPEYSEVDADELFSPDDRERNRLANSERVFRQYRSHSARIDALVQQANEALIRPTPSAAPEHRRRDYDGLFLQMFLRYVVQSASGTVKYVPSVHAIAGLTSLNTPRLLS
jgi:nucleoside-diphosphate-sugar epimerase